MRRSIINKCILPTVFIISCAILFRYGKRVNVFYGDALGYYLYLPSTFIYHNLHAPGQLPSDKLIGKIIFDYVRDMQVNRAPNGNIVDQYTYGIALMEAPFFFMAHAWEKAMGLPANGFSETYYYLIKVSAMFYALLGLVLVYKILKNYFSQPLALLTTAALFLGTNLLWFSLFQTGMSHVPLFFLYALLMLLTIRLHQRPRPWLFIAAGLTAGLITIIRPTDILCLLIPVLYNVYNKETVYQKLLFLKANLAYLLLFAFAFVLPILPQLLYWKAVAGSYVYYSYGSQGFNWRHPKIMDGLFYFSNGWLPYSPIMIFSLLGLLFFKPAIKWKWVIVAILPIYIYIIYSWYCYTYINGLGSRPMIQLYPLLALPLAAFIQQLAQQKWIVKSAFCLACVFFIAVNICFSMQQEEGVLWSEQSNGMFNLQMLFRMHLKYNDLVVNDVAEFQPDSSKLTKIGTLACAGFDDSVSSHFIRDTVFGGKYLYHTQDEEISAKIAINWDKQKCAGARWLKCSGTFMYPQSPGYNKHLLVLDIDRTLWKGCKIENKISGRQIDTAKKNMTLEYNMPGKWGYVSFYVKVPRHIADGNMVKLFVWSTGKTDLYIQNVCMELYK